MDVATQPISDKHFTIEEWLALEAKTGKKYEWHKGELWDWHAMAGATPRHVRIASDTAFALGAGLRGVDNGCVEHNSDLALHVESEGRFYYPDGSVTCGELEISAVYENAILNPILLFEVVSKTSESRDRKFKPQIYRLIPSLVYYLIIAQDEPWVTLQITGDTPDRYSTEEYKSLEDNINLPRLGITLSMKDIYGRVSFPSQEPVDGNVPED